MLKQLFPDDEKILGKIQAIQETSQMSKTIIRSTSHICNATLKKPYEKASNEFSKFRTNMSFRSSNSGLGNSKLMTHTRGFSMTNFSNFNQLNKTSYTKPKLEPLSENNINQYCKDYHEEDKEYLFKNKLENIKNINNNINYNSKNFDSINEKENDSNVNDKHFSYLNNNYNFYGTRSSFNSLKKEKQSLSLKTADPNSAVYCDKSSGMAKMPIISNSINANLTKTKMENNVYSNNNAFNLKGILDDKFKKKIIEKDIEKKIESFKIKLNSDMLKVLKEEKQKEEERENKYNKATSEMEKRRLESFIALERVQSSERIIRLNE